MTVIMTFIYFLFSIFLIQYSSAKYVSSTKNSLDGWLFLSRFCFLSDGGVLDFEIHYEGSYGFIDLLFYYNDPVFWIPLANNLRNWSCKRKRAFLEYFSNQSIKLEPYTKLCNYRDDVTNIIICRYSNLQFHTSKPTWWFIAVSNCNLKKIQVSYNLTFKNGEAGNIFREQFSADEMAIYPTSIGFFISYFLLCVMAIVFLIQLKLIQRLHSTFQQYVASVIFMFFHFIFYLAAYGEYSKSGIMMDGLTYVGDAFYIISYVLFVGMLLQLAFGYTVVCGKLPLYIFAMIIIFLLSYVTVYVALLIYEAVTFNEMYLLYRYESPPGVGLLVIQICAWLFFTGACIYTIIIHKRRRVTFLVLLVLYTLWFWALPIVVICCYLYSDSSVRKQVSFGCESMICFLGHAVYLLMSCPIQDNDCFPYSQTENKIGNVSLQQATDNALEGRDDDASTSGGELNEIFDNTDECRRITRLFQTQSAIPTNDFTQQNEKPVHANGIDNHAYGEGQNNFYNTPATGSGNFGNGDENQIYTSNQRHLDSLFTISK